MPVGETLVAKALGQKVKDFRLNKLMTQTELAKAIGVGLSTIVRLEAEEGEPYVPSDLVRVKIEKFLKANREQAA
jgi:DNA-binding XRE family transcriptional regulator